MSPNTLTNEAMKVSCEGWNAVPEAFMIHCWLEANRGFDRFVEVIYQVDAVTGSWESVITFEDTGPAFIRYHIGFVEVYRYVSLFKLQRIFRGDWNSEGLLDNILAFATEPIETANEA